MGNRWAEEFYNLTESKGIECRIKRKNGGWIETINFAGKIYYTRSKSYDGREFFIGVGPSKLDDEGDFVLICGGKENTLSHIFIIPWGVFFETLEKGAPINTFSPPKKPYFQYKCHLRDRDGRWLMSVQGGNTPILDVSRWHYSVDEAIAFINNPNSCS